jgi:hypothetical protein
MPESVDTLDSSGIELCFWSEVDEVLAWGEPPADSGVLFLFIPEVARDGSESDPPKSRCTSDD